MQSADPGPRRLSGDRARRRRAGAMFAASMLLGRALQPVEQIVGSWRNLSSARAGIPPRSTSCWRPVRERALTLPRPAGRLAVEDVTYVVPGSRAPMLRGVSFALEPGEVLGVIGPSGRRQVDPGAPLVGVLRRRRRGAARRRRHRAWARTTWATISATCRRTSSCSPTRLPPTSAASETDNDGASCAPPSWRGCTKWCCGCPTATRPRSARAAPSCPAATRQRIGLARAVYGEPSLVVLDEPTSNLDAKGDSALADCVHHLKNDGTTTVVISHRLSTMGVVDKILVLRDGRRHVRSARRGAGEAVRNSRPPKADRACSRVRRIRSGG